MASGFCWSAFRRLNSKEPADRALPNDGRFCLVSAHVALKGDLHKPFPFAHADVVLKGDRVSAFTAPGFVGPPSGGQPPRAFANRALPNGGLLCLANAPSP